MLLHLLLEVKMKNNWKNVSVFTATLIMAFGVTNAFAQYGSGACAPTCEVPTASYAPSCDVPTCDVPGCDVGCGPSTCYGSGCYGDGCYGENGCFSLYGLVNGALNVAVSPFRWIYCEFTDGIFPDCGCAPRPPKAPCNPCTICGDYVGGCNDNCEGYPAGNYCCQDAGGYANTYPSGVYSSAVYDVEQYDASPTRGGQALPTLPINRGGRNDFSMKSRNFNVSNMFGPAPRISNVRSVSYEQQNANSVPAQVSQRVVVSQVQPPVRNDVQKIQSARELQNKQNVRIVAETAELGRAANSKTFGTTRTVQ